MKVNALSPNPPSVRGWSATVKTTYAPSPALMAHHHPSATPSTQGHAPPSVVALIARSRTGTDSPVYPRALFGTLTFALMPLNLFESVLLLAVYPAAAGLPAAARSSRGAVFWPAGMVQSASCRHGAPLAGRVVCHKHHGTCFISQASWNLLHRIVSSSQLEFIQRLLQANILFLSCQNLLVPCLKLLLPPGLILLFHSEHRFYLI